MTEIERKLINREHKKHMLISLIDKQIFKLKEYNREESMNHYYADSWEQAAQISKRMDKNNEYIVFLNIARRKLICGLDIGVHEINMIKTLYSRKTFH